MRTEVGKAAVLVLLMGGICDVWQRDGPGFRDVRCKFNEYRSRRSEDMQAHTDSEVIP